VFGRTPRLPSELAPELERDERVITWARAGDGAVVVTNRGLWLPGAGERIGWHEIHKAVWAEGTLTVIGSTADPRPEYAVAVDAPAVSVHIDDPGAVPRRIRERVNNSVAFTSVYPVAGGGSARVVARRVSGQDGLRWSVRLEGVSARNYEDDPLVRETVDDLVASAKASILATE
jgi:hypothetical protein